MNCNRTGFHQAQMPFFRGGYRRPKYNVPVNISETETAFEVQVYATGFGKEDIKISVKDDVLLINGQKELENAPKFTQQEFPVKTFERMVALNGKVESENISAKHLDGVLNITLPKSKEALRKDLIVNVQ
jgi:HSP20 family protein